MLHHAVLKHDYVSSCSTPSLSTPPPKKNPKPLKQASIIVELRYFSKSELKPFHRTLYVSTVKIGQRANMQCIDQRDC